MALFVKLEKNEIQFGYDSDPDKEVASWLSHHVKFNSAIWHLNPMQTLVSTENGINFVFGEDGVYEIKAIWNEEQQRYDWDFVDADNISALTGMKI